MSLYPLHYAMGPILAVVADNLSSTTYPTLNRIAPSATIPVEFADHPILTGNFPINFLFHFVQSIAVDIVSGSLVIDKVSFLTTNKVLPAEPPMNPMRPITNNVNHREQVINALNVPPPLTIYGDWISTERDTKSRITVHLVDAPSHLPIDEIWGSTKGFIMEIARKSAHFVKWHLSIRPRWGITYSLSTGKVLRWSRLSVESAIRHSGRGPHWRSTF